MTLPPALEFVGVTRHFAGNRAAAVDGLSFAVPHGSLVALVGESGSGKTTALRLAAGFETPDAGVVRVAGESVADATGRFVPADRRGVGLVFQDHALFPHLSVEDNVAFGLRRLRSDRRGERVAEVLKRVELSGLEKRMPHTLSGGQQQRVALARALAPEPRVLLLDEPFSSLDPALRDQVRNDVCNVLRSAGASALFVTHEARDALCLADHIVVLSDGRLEQAGTPAEVYDRPSSEYVAQAFGACNVLQAELTHTGFATAFGNFPRGIRHEGLPDGPYRIGIRPQRLRVSPAADDANTRIMSTTYHGDHWEATIVTQGSSAVVRAHFPRLPTVGSGVLVSCDAEHVLSF